MVAGLAGAGVDVLRLGVIPTPGVAHLTAELGADLGVMLSASHNPAADNGIKLFARGGFKLPDAAEDEIEARLADPGRFRPGQPAGGFGRVRDARGSGNATLPTCSPPPPASGSGGEAHGAAAGGAAGGRAAPLAGMRVVVDCAHGAASELRPGAAAAGGCRRDRDRRRARRAEHQRRLRFHAPGDAVRRRGQARRRRRYRA